MYTLPKRALTEQSKPIVRSRKDLILLMQDLGFGKIWKLQVRNGNPVLDPLPAIEEIFSFTRERRIDRSLKNALQKTQIAKLFQKLDRINNGVIEQIVVYDGLPVRANRWRNR